MAAGTEKTAETQSTTRANAKASAKQPAAKPAARPVRKRAPVATKAVTPAAKKPASRTATRNSPAAKKVAHEPEPFVAKGNKAGKLAKGKKAKLVRDSFTMPEGEYALIATLKKRCLHAGVSAKKSEILRAAVANLARLGDSSVVAAVRRLEVIKTGRPAKGSK
jgi:hypothetical protein